jgi:antitoxin component YwqK of YwqJK toxin-antitoxin module
MSESVRNGSLETDRGITWYDNGFISRSGEPAVLIYFQDTTDTRIEKWYLQGKLHRTDGGPTVTEYEEVVEGQYEIKKQEYHTNGRLNRVGAPARISFTNILRDEDIVSYLTEEYYLNGRLHNGSLTVTVGGNTFPYAVKRFVGEVETEVDGSIVYTPKYTYESYTNGLRRSTGDAPAIAKDVYGANFGDRYWYNSVGKLHRGGDLPAIIYSTGREEWYLDGKLSRTGNPAITVPASYTGGSQGQSWYLDGKLHRIAGEALFEDTALFFEETPQIKILRRKILRREYWTYGRNNNSTIEAVEGLTALVLSTPAISFVHGGQSYVYSESLSSASTPVFVENNFSSGVLLVGYREQSRAYFTTGLAKEVTTTIYDEEGSPIDTIDSYEYLVNGRRHRYGNPAVVKEDGTREYWLEGKLHRTDGPAIIRPDVLVEFDGTQEYYTNGKLHRDGGPAVIRPDGTQEYYTNGKLHRDGGPAVIRPDGTQEYYTNGKLHRDGGPAVIRPDGTQEYYTNGKRNRLDGPAVEYPSVTLGSTTFTPYEYWVNGVIERGGDLPAIKRKNGTEEWYIDGKISRTGKPAVIQLDGTEEWYENGLLNRVGGPAISKPDGYRAYYLKGKLHRTDGPAIKYPNGSEEFYIRKLSDDAPPGITDPDEIEKYTQSVLSRNDDLPAVIRKNDSGVTVAEEYWIDGYRFRSDDLPAVINWDSSGLVVRREWWDEITYTVEYDVVGKTAGVQNTRELSFTVNVLSRSGNPAVIDTKGGVTREEYWDRGGKNVEGAPAVIEYNDMHDILKEYWRSSYDEERGLVKGSRLERDPEDLSKPVIEKFDPDTGALVFKVLKTSSGEFTQEFV